MKVAKGLINPVGKFIQVVERVNELDHSDTARAGLDHAAQPEAIRLGYFDEGSGGWGNRGGYREPV